MATASRKNPEVNGLKVLVTLTQEENGLRRSDCPVFHGQRMPELWRATSAVENIPAEFAYMFRTWTPNGQGRTAKEALADLVACLKSNNLHGTLRVVNVIEKGK